MQTFVQNETVILWGACLWPMLPFIAAYNYYVHLRFSFGLIFFFTSSHIPLSQFIAFIIENQKRNLLYCTWLRKKYQTKIVYIIFLKDIKWQNQSVHCIVECALEKCGHPCSLCWDPHNLSPSYTHLQGKTNSSPIWECQQSEDPAYSGGYIHFGP